MFIHIGIYKERVVYNIPLHRTKDCTQHRQNLTHSTYSIPHTTLTKRRT